MNMTITFIIFRELHRFYVFLSSLIHLTSSWGMIPKHTKKNQTLNLNTDEARTDDIMSHILYTHMHVTLTRQNNVKRAIKLTQFTNYGTPFDFYTLHFFFLFFLNDAFIAHFILTLPCFFFLLLSYVVYLIYDDSEKR